MPDACKEGRARTEQEMKDAAMDASSKIRQQQIEGYFRERADGREFFSLYDLENDSV